MIPNKNHKFEVKETFSKKIIKMILKIFGYPYSVVKKYNNYNIRVGEIINELNDQEIDRFRKINSKFLLSFIYLPLIFSFLFSVVSIVSHRKDYAKYWNNLIKKEESRGLFDNISKKGKKIKYAVSNIPIQKDDFILILYGYIAAFLGARFLDMHVAFNKEKEITNIFSSLGYTDAEGRPWKVTWTPDAIMITAFNCDPIQLCENNRFWSTINFKPAAPKVFKNNRSKFIVTQVYELNSNMIFSFDEQKIKPINKSEFV